MGTTPGRVTIARTGVRELTDLKLRIFRVYPVTRDVLATNFLSQDCVMEDQLYEKYLIEFADIIQQSEAASSQPLNRPTKEHLINLCLAMKAQKERRATAVDAPPASTTIEEVQSTLGVNLPDAYRGFLKQRENEEHAPCLNDPTTNQDWTLATLSAGNSLLRPCYDGKTPYAHLHRGLISEIPLQSSSDATEADECLTIGKDESGDLLLLNPNTESLSCFVHDGSYLEFVSPTFSEWLARTVFRSK